jgi:hypothetical protein
MWSGVQAKTRAVQVRQKIPVARKQAETDTPADANSCSLRTGVTNHPVEQLDFRGCCCICVGESCHWASQIEGHKEEDLGWPRQAAHRADGISGLLGSTLSGSASPCDVSQSVPISGNDYDEYWSGHDGFGPPSPRKFHGLGHVERGQGAKRAWAGTVAGPGPRGPSVPRTLPVAT